MPTIPVGHAEFTMIFHCTGVTRDITWAHGFDVDTLPADAPSVIAQDIYVKASTSGCPYAPAAMSTDWAFDGVAVAYMTEEGPLLGQYSFHTQGTATAPPVPVNSAILVTKNTTLGGRRNRGRFYAPPCFPTEANIDAAGRISGANVTGLQTAFSAFFDLLVDDTYELELFHQSAPFTPGIVTGWTVESLLATQRRRMRN